MFLYSKLERKLNWEYNKYVEGRLDKLGSVGLVETQLFWPLLSTLN